MCTVIQYEQYFPLLNKCQQQGNKSPLPTFGKSGKYNRHERVQAWSVPCAQVASRRIYPRIGTVSLMQEKWDEENLVD